MCVQLNESSGTAWITRNRSFRADALALNALFSQQRRQETRPTFFKRLLSLATRVTGKCRGSLAALCISVVVGTTVASSSTFEGEVTKQRGEIAISPTWPRCCSTTTFTLTASTRSPPTYNSTNLGLKDVHASCLSTSPAWRVRVTVDEAVHSVPAALHAS